MDGETKHSNYMMIQINRKTGQVVIPVKPIDQSSRFWPIETWEERQERFRGYALKASKSEVEAMPLAPIAV